MANTVTITHWRVNETKPAFSEAQAGSFEIGTSEGSGRIYASVEDAKADVARLLESEDVLFALAMACGFAHDPSGKNGMGALGKEITVDLSVTEPIQIRVADPLSG